MTGTPSRTAGVSGEPQNLKQAAGKLLVRGTRRRAGQRVLDGVERFMREQLKLKVNRDKSAVARPWSRKFLGYTFTMHHQPKIKVAPESVKRFKNRLREELHQARGRNLRRVLGKLQSVLPARYFTQLGLVSLVHKCRELNRPLN